MLKLFLNELEIPFENSYLSKEGKNQIALSLFDKGLTADEISKLVGLSRSTVFRLKNLKNETANTVSNIRGEKINNCSVKNLKNETTDVVSKTTINETTEMEIFAAAKPSQIVSKYMENETSERPPENIEDNCCLKIQENNTINDVSNTVINETSEGPRETQEISIVSKDVENETTSIVSNPLINETDDDFVVHSTDYYCRALFKDRPRKISDEALEKFMFSTEATWENFAAKWAYESEGTAEQNKLIADIEKIKERSYKEFGSYVARKTEIREKPKKSYEEELMELCGLSR